MTKSLPYYPRYPRDLIEGTIGMSFEAKTSYSFLIDLIYMQGGQLPDDSRYIAGMFNCSVRKWNSIKEELLSLGKITIKNGFIQNYRALIELEKLSKYRDKQAENGRASNKNNNLAEPALNHTKPNTNSKKIETKVSTKKSDAALIRESLKTVLDDTHSDALIKHRRSKKSPLTLHAANLIAKKLSATADANAVVDIMIEKGWQSFEPEWLENIKAGSSPRGSPPAKQSTSTKDALDKILGNANENLSRNQDGIKIIEH